MKTVWILAQSLHSAMQALNKNLEGPSAFQEEFIQFRFIATADQVRSLPTQETFIVVQNWRGRPDADEVLGAIKERGWQSISLQELFLS